MRRIADPVHGLVELDSLGADLLETAAFRRLRGVKQLGLAHLVFPGADYSRFSHSVGTAHVARRILRELRDRGSEISAEEERLYTAAALLHDIGHYPFSHALERAVENHYKAALSQSKSAPPPESPDLPADSLDHEGLGSEIIGGGSEVTEILTRNGVSAEEIVSIILHRKESPRFANLISSELDVDRIDYLLRTARHTGLPYGQIDLDYLAGQLCLDSEDRLAFNRRALRTAEHLLLARYFDYQQITLHKAIVGMELLLVDVVMALLSEGHMDCSAAALRAKARTDDWAFFDDGFLVEQIRSLAVSSPDVVVKRKAHALLNRNVPKLVYSDEFFGERFRTREARLLYEHATDKRAQWAALAGVDESEIFYWERPMAVTKPSAHVPLSGPTSEDDEALEEAVRVLKNSDSNESEPIEECAASLLSVLADRQLYSMRVYVLLEGSRDEVDDRRLALQDRILQDLAG